MSGEKTSTIRRDDAVFVGPATFVFEGHPDFACVEGEILSIEPLPIEPLRLQNLDTEHAAGLKTHHPAMPEDAELLRVAFRVNGS